MGSEGGPDPSWSKENSEVPEIEIEVIPETPVAPKRKSNMAKAKQMWGSSEEHDDDILDRFLRVKKFQESGQPSYESDGIPSIVGIDDDLESASEVGSYARNARRMFAQLEQFSNDNNHPDLESISDDDMPKSDLRRARELYEELR